MATLVRVPVLGIAIANIEINRWAVREGEPVTRGETLLEVQTDKMAMEVPAEASGTVLKVFFHEQAQLTAGVPIAIIGTPGDDIRALVMEAEAGLKDLSQPVAWAASAPATAVEAPAAAPPREILASPVAKRVAREQGIDLSKVTPTGPGGRISQEDVLEYAEQLRAAATVTASAPAEGDDPVEVIPLRGARKAIAEHMVRSVHTSAHYTMGIEVDCTRLVALRGRLKDEFKQAHGLELTYVPFMVKAIALAVRDVPIVNATVREDAIAVQKVAHVGVAVAVGDLIFVPVIRRPIAKAVFDIAREAAEYAQAARENRLKPEQARGSTITLTNIGVADIDVRAGTSVINQPEVANVIMGRIRDRVVPIDGAIGIRPILDVTFTYDHRVVMGVPGARFAERVKHYLENPDSLLEANGGR